MIWDMPMITTRICGICPTAHHLASVKACEAVFDVEIPPAAKMLRELLVLGSGLEDQALHFFFLAAPDLVLGPESDPVKRNVMGIVGADKELAMKAIRLRKIGKNIVERVGGSAIHPVTAIPGGMSKPITAEDRYSMLQYAKEAITYSDVALTLVNRLFEQYAELAPVFATFDSLYMGLTNDGSYEEYDGMIRVVDKDGAVAAEFSPQDYANYIGERVEDYSWAKFPYWKAGDETYRVGPLARLNVAEKIDTPFASAALYTFKKMGNGKPLHGSLYYHFARVIELMYKAEKIKKILEDDEIMSTDVRVKVERKAGEGVGVVEAPRGTLIHHYVADDFGKLEKANLIVPTTHNNKAIDIAIALAAKDNIRGDKLTEGVFNTVEMAARCYDPCLSCATHAIGQMPLEIVLYGHDGKVLDTARRG
jgi:NAD-reducing hydrogenase large subunit